MIVMKRGYGIFVWSIRFICVLCWDCCLKFNKVGMKVKFFLLVIVLGGV